MTAPERGRLGHRCHGQAQEDHQGHKFKVKVTVTTASGVPAGTVQVYLGTKLLGTGTLKSNGKVTIKISEKKAKKLKVGKNTLTAKYLGSATVATQPGCLRDQGQDRSASNALTAGPQVGWQDGHQYDARSRPAGPCISTTDRRAAAAARRPVAAVDPHPLPLAQVAGGRLAATAPC